MADEVPDGVQDEVPDALVVGGGVAGAAVALELLDRGAEVLVLDPGEDGASTRAAAGMLTARYECAEDASLLRLGMRSRALHPRFLSRVRRLAGADPGLRVDGMLVVNRDADAEEEAREMVRWQARALGTEEAGPEPRILSPEEAASRHPWASREATSYLWLPGEGQVDAQALAAALPGAVRAAGGTVLPEAAAALRTRDGRAAGVETRGGRMLDAGAVVLAAGAWSGRVEGLPRPLPVRPVRGQILRLDPPGEPPAPLLADHGGRYAVPREDGTVVAGSTMEDAGFDASVTDGGRSSIRRAAADLAPALGEARLVEEWAGLRPVSGDGRPILGPDPAVDGLHYAAGYGRSGVLLAPAAAAVVADLLLEGETGREWRPFRPGRFPAAPPPSSG